MFITALTSARHLSLSWGSSIQSIPPHPTSWRSVLILSSHLCLGLHIGLFPSGFRTKTLYKPLLFPYVLHAPPISFFSIWSSEKYCVGSTEHWPSHYVVFSTPCHLIPRSPEYSPQRPILKHPRPQHVPLYKTIYNYTFLYIFIYLLRYTHIRDRTIDKDRNYTKHRNRTQVHFLKTEAMFMAWYSLLNRIIHHLLIKYSQYTYSTQCITYHHCIY